MHGVPSIASNLPGVRQPVRQHQMGRIIPIGDAQALAQVVVEIAEKPADYDGTPNQIRQVYQPEAIAIQYEALFEKLERDLE